MDLTASWNLLNHTEPLGSDMDVLFQKALMHQSLDTLMQWAAHTDINTPLNLLQKPAVGHTQPRRFCPTPLALAYHTGWLQGTDYLLRQGADPNAQNDTELTPIGALEPKTSPTMMVHLFERLLQAGFNIHAADRNGKTLLMYLTQSENLSLMRIVLRLGAAPQTLAYSASALHYAINSSRIDPLALLLQYVDDAHVPDANGMSPLVWAAHKGTTGGQWLVQDPNVLAARQDVGFEMMQMLIPKAHPQLDLHYLYTHFHQQAAARLSYALSYYEQHHLNQNTPQSTSTEESGKGSKSL